MNNNNNNKTMNAVPAHAMNPRPGAMPKSMGQRPMQPMQGYMNQAPMQSPYGKSIGAPNANRPVQQMPPQQAPQRQPVPPSYSQPQQMSQQSYAQPRQQAVMPGPPSGHPGRPNRPVISESSVSRDPISAFVDIIRSMVSGFAALDEELLKKNIELANGKGMSIGDRTITFECADYLMSNIAYIFMGLVLDAAFKDAFMEALIVEINFDTLAPDVQKTTRESMKDNREYESAGQIVIGVTSFMPHILNNFMDKMQAGFDSLDGFADEFDAEVAELTDEQRIKYGFIFSNFMYLIRAFTHNDAFMSYVVTVIEKVKEIVASQKS